MKDVYFYSFITHEVFFHLQIMCLNLMVVEMLFNIKIQICFFWNEFMSSLKLYIMCTLLNELYG